jgi:hypothetical protein
MVSAAGRDEMQGRLADLPTEVIQAGRRVSDRDQIADEDEGLAQRDHAPGAPVTVGQGRGMISWRRPPASMPPRLGPSRG